MNRQELINQIIKKKSVLCVGLDTDIDKIPKHLLQKEEPILAFNKAIIDATKDYAVAYKINTAFYEAMGIEGWKIMEETRKYIPKECFTIADAKRGDIGNTSLQYAKTFFHTYPYDSVTVAPYMGEDSIKPFLGHSGKWAIILGLTSNNGCSDFQMLQTDNLYLYEEVLKKTSQYGSIDDTMYVIGATRTDQFINVRKIIPHHFLLIPGVGAQGGDLNAIMEHATNDDYSILVNVSRGILYTDDSTAYQEAARKAAASYQGIMANFIKEK